MAQVKRTERTKAFDIWKIENDLSVEGLAKELGLSYQRLSFLIRRSETVTPQMHKRLSQFIPERLLPPARPKTRSKPSQLQNATVN